MAELESVTVEAEVPVEDATREIAKAVSARHSIARKYLMRMRRRHPDATPADVIRLLERHYGTSITAAGALMTAGAIAADIGIAMIPGVGAAAAGVKSAGAQAAKKTGKELAKSAAKQAATNMAKGGAQKATALLPAGDEQLQFELTAIFALAIADIHSMNLDKEQAQALVYGLSSELVNQQDVAKMAADISATTPGGAASTGKKIAAGRQDWSHWANTLADSLPGGAAQSLVRTMQTGQLETVRGSLSERQQTTIEYSVGAVAGGIARFAFGRKVIIAARAAFAEPPDVFPAHLAVVEGTETGDSEVEQNRAIAALEDAARTTGAWLANTATSVSGGMASGAVAVGTGMSKATGSATRVFRSVDLDGDGIPDEPQAITAAKGVGSAIAGTAGSLGGSVASLFSRKKRSADGRGHPDSPTADEDVDDQQTE